MRYARRLAVVVAISLVMTLAACTESWDKFNQAWLGASATLMTFDENSQLMDKVHGTGFHFEQDARFDSVSSDGKSNGDSQVILITVNGAAMSHVGSTMIVAEDGLVPIAGADSTVTYDSVAAKPGVPWLNILKDRFATQFAGKAKTIMIRSQNGTPIAVYAGNDVRPYATEVPKSTWFRIDGKMLLVYRADYTSYDTALLGS